MTHGVVGRSHDHTRSTPKATGCITVLTGTATLEIPVKMFNGDDVH